ncbi:glycosyltransferase [Nitratireductor aquimarinus]|nr:glycosyltransferase [Nitratireductor aquimarinus]MBN7790256.1 glycosyltransferase [Nitratireductor aquimarinus]
MREGFEVRAQALLPDAHIDAIYGESPRPSYLGYMRSYAQRSEFIARLPRGAIGWVEKEVFAWMPAIADRLGMRRFGTTILDLDDAWFANYELADRFPARLLRQKMSQLFERADIITVANQFLLEEVGNRGGRDVRVLGQAIDTHRYRPLRERRETGRVTIGWIGTPLNAALYLPPVVEALNRLVRENGCRVLLIGAGSSVPELNAERRGWSEDTEVESILEFDIGIMPLTDTVWNRCKSGYKLVQSMACGQVPVGTAVGFNQVLITHEVDGMLINPDRPQDWFETLRYLVQNPDLRYRLGAAARQTIESNYTIDKLSDEVASLFRTLV